jgi:hypothetical protein
MVDGSKGVPASIELPYTVHCLLTAVFLILSILSIPVQMVLSFRQVQELAHHL